MAESSGTFAGQGGLRIFYRRWLPEGGLAAARASLVLVHGVAEHSGRYEHVGLRYASRGYAVWALDLRGLGQSEGVKGHVDRFDDYTDDLSILVGMAREALPGKKVFLVGHSKGGLIALYFSQQRGAEIDGVAASAPGLALAVKVPPSKLALARTMAGILPRFAQYNEVDPGVLSHDPEVGRRYVADPLLCRRVTARWFVEFSGAMQRTMDGAATYAGPPVLLLAAGDDRLVDSDRIRQYYDQLAAADKEFHRFEGFYHELFNEVERDKVFAVLDRWLERQVA